MSTGTSSQDPGEGSCVAGELAFGRLDDPLVRDERTAQVLTALEAP